ncbi:MAG: aldo/keto reductase [Bacteroidota bacterium]
MHTRELGRGGPLCSEIGFGAWAIGGPWRYGWGKTDDAVSEAAIRRALEEGVNWIDTAAVYGLGRSEEVVGRAVRGLRDRVFIATKCGQIWDAAGNVRTHAGAGSIRAEMEASLRRLGTEYVDLYQIHWPDRETPVEESWTEMARLRAEGKTRFIGVCNFGVDLLERCTRIERVQSLQPIYNLLERGIEREILPYCRREGIGVVAYSPMQSGLLTGSFDMRRLPPDDWRVALSEKFREPGLSRGLALVEFLRPMAARYGVSVGRLAVAWVLHQEGITSAIVGARTPLQAAENAAASQIRIQSPDLEAMEEYVRRRG